MTAIAPSVAEAVGCAGGWLFDQVLSGWDVTVITPERIDPRPLRILGVRGSYLEDALSAPLAGPCLEALALRTDLYAGDARIRRLVMRAAEANGAEIRLWGDTWPEDFDAVGAVSHQLSLAARAFKAHALAAVTGQAAAQAESTADTEVFQRGEIRRPLLAVAH